MRLKITQRGFETFNGQISGIQFENGESTEHVSKHDARRLASIMSMEDADTGKNPSWTQELVENRAKMAMPNGALGVEGEKPKQKAEPVDAPEPVNVPVTEPAPHYNFTRESLEALADEGGIAAVREFAEQYDVRGGSIAAIIASLLAKKAQAEKAAEA